MFLGMGPSAEIVITSSSLQLLAHTKKESAFLYGLVYTHKTCINPLLSRDPKLGDME